MVSGMVFLGERKGDRLLCFGPYRANREQEENAEKKTVSGTVFLFLVDGPVVQEIVDDLEAALEQFRLIANDLGSEPPEKRV